MREPAIEINGVGKRYHLGEDFAASRYLTLRESLMRRPRRRSEAESELWALKDISATVNQGEVVGVIGRNGAGKSTLLKLLARIIEPSTGILRTRGRVGALLEVGTGFHPELTGRENVFLNGSILGLSRRETSRLFDDIVEFAGFEKFLDTPLKRFSTGMSLRLAFAVAAHVRPPIVAVDEVLAVGDAEFRKKSLGAMSDLGDSGRTVVFVSHDLAAISQLCSRTIWLENGSIAADGETADVVSTYLGSRADQGMEAVIDSSSRGPVRLRRAEILNKDGDVVSVADRSQAFSIRVSFELTQTLPYLDMAITLTNPQGVKVLDESYSDTGNLSLAKAPGHYQLTLRLPAVLASDDYTLGVWAGAFEETFDGRDVLTFHLWPGEADPTDWRERGRIVQPPVRWGVSRMIRDA